MQTIKKIKEWLRPWVPPIILNLKRNSSNLTLVEFSLPFIELETIAKNYQSTILEFPGSQIYRTKSMVLPLGDLLSIAVLTKVRCPRRIFEIGTYTGSSTLILSINSSPTTEITTLDLGPSDMPSSLLDELGKPVYEAGILFQQTPYASKIRQVYGKSEKFDFSDFFGKIDFVYIDADHSYEAVLRDSETAIKMLKPGGIIVWDDYRWLPEHAECIGVTKALNELSKKFPIYQLQGTRLAVCDMQVHKN